MYHRSSLFVLLMPLMLKFNTKKKKKKKTFVQNVRKLDSDATKHNFRKLYKSCCIFIGNLLNSLSMYSILLNFTTVFSFFSIIIIQTGQTCIIFHVHNYFSDLHGLTLVFYFNLNFSLLFMRSHFFSELHFPSST